MVFSYRLENPRTGAWSRKAYSKGTGVSSRSGQTLAYAVAWCEKHKQPYMIAAMPGVGYHLKLARARRDGAGHGFHGGK